MPDDRQMVLAGEFGNPLDGIPGRNAVCINSITVQAGVTHVLKDSGQHGSNIVIGSSGAA